MKNFMRDIMEDITKKLQKMVQARKRPIVVYKQGEINPYARKRTSTSTESYYSSYNDN